MDKKSNKDKIISVVLAVRGQVIRGPPNRAIKIRLREPPAKGRHGGTLKRNMKNVQAFLSAHQLRRPNGRSHLASSMLRE